MTTDIVPGDAGESAAAPTGPSLADVLASPELAAASEAPMDLPDQEGAAVIELHKDQPRDAEGRFAPPDEPTPQVQEAQEEELAEALSDDKPTVDEPKPEPEDGAVVLKAKVGDETVELELDADGEAREALEAIQSQAERATVLEEQLQVLEGQRAEIEANMEELDTLEQQIRIDPAGFLLERIPATTREQLAIELLHDEKVLQAAHEKIEEWMRDPASRRIAAAELRADRVERKAKMDQELAKRRGQRSAVKEIMTGINELIPPEMSPEDAEYFRDDAVREVVAYVKQNSMSNLPREELRRVLSRRMKQYGISAEGARASQNVTEETGARLRATVARRKAAAATAPATAGNIPSVSRPPKGSTLDDAFKWADQNLASG